MVDILQHLAQQEQGELEWARLVREMILAVVGEETRLRVADGQLGNLREPTS